MRGSIVGTIVCSAFLAFGICPNRLQATDGCHLSQASGRTGGGCCDVAPPQCDHFVYTYNADCVGTCPPDKACVSTGTTNVLVYWYQDCYGNCNALPDSCQLGEYIVHYGPEPSACKCGTVKVGP